MSEELKPCPFCGCHGQRVVSDTNDTRRHTIKCPDCPGKAEFYSSSRKQAIAAWNRRADRDAVIEECAQVCDEIEEPNWHGYENPNTFNDGKYACAEAIRALKGK